MVIVGWWLLDGGCWMISAEWSTPRCFYIYGSWRNATSMVCVIYQDVNVGVAWDSQERWWKEGRNKIDRHQAAIAIVSGA